MKEEARRILVEVVKKEREGAWKNWETCQGLMKDYGGNEHGEMAVLAAALLYGVVERLRDCMGREVSEGEMRGMVEEFQRKSFYEMGICGWAVESWAVAMGMDVDVDVDGPRLLLLRVLSDRSWAMGMDGDGDGDGGVSGRKEGTEVRKGIVKERRGIKNVVKKCGECGTSYGLDYEGECEVDLGRNWLLWCVEHRKGVSESGCEECGGKEEGDELRRKAEMVEVLGGELPSDSKVPEKRVGRFWVGKYAVTWGEWKEVREWAVKNGYELEEGRGEGEKHPVTKVNWYSVVKWCNARSEKEGLEAFYYALGEVYRSGEEDEIQILFVADGYRLPRDGEWEWEARGGVKGKGCEYSGSNDLREVGWYGENSEGETHEVGMKKANELGIYDLSGNVWEWCFDQWGSTGTYRVMRGGSWSAYAYYARVSYRYLYGPSGSNFDIGFRVVRSSVP